MAEMINELLKDFNVERNETDRRIYYEVMGRRIGQNEEFDDRDSSDEDWGLLKAPDPQIHAFSYGADFRED